MKRLSLSHVYSGIALVALAFGFVSSASAEDSDRREAPEDAEAYLIWPVNGRTVEPTFRALFGLQGMGIAPAGIDMPNTGHHHLLIDVKKLPDLDEPLPASENIIHFGGGQTETELTLELGEHTLQLILADHTHTPHKKPVVSKKITITVAEKE